MSNLSPNPYRNYPASASGVAQSPYRLSDDSPSNRMPPPNLSRNHSPGEMAPTSKHQYRVRKRRGEYLFVATEITYFLNNRQLLAADTAAEHREIFQLIQRNMNISDCKEEHQAESDIASMLRSTPNNPGPAEMAIHQSKLSDEQKYRAAKSSMVSSWMNLLDILQSTYPPHVYDETFGIKLIDEDSIIQMSADVNNWCQNADWEYAQLQRN